MWNVAMWYAQVYYHIDMALDATATAYVLNVSLLPHTLHDLTNYFYSLSSHMINILNEQKVSLPILTAYGLILWLILGSPLH